MSLGTGALKVSGEGPEVIQAPRGGLHGNPPHLTFLGGCLQGGSILYPFPEKTA